MEGKEERIEGGREGDARERLGRRKEEGDEGIKGEGKGEKWRREGRRRRNRERGRRN